MKYYYFSNKGYQMTCTILKYRGNAYIKKDTGKYLKDTPANREILLDQKRFMLKKEANEEI